jgi:hypothetical protein
MKPVRLAVLTLAMFALAGCAGDNYVQKSEPSFYRNLAQPGAQLDTAAAASMISGYRANMLLKGATRIGIAAVYTPTSKYKVYWALILAEPEDGKR